MRIRAIRGNFRPVPSYGFKDAGIEGDYRVLRRTHEQILMDRLEAHDYKEGSVIEISAKRLRHSMQKAVRHYADLRTARGQKAAQEAWETPVVEARVRGVSASAKRQTRHDRKRRRSRTRPNGGMADPEGSVISP